MLFRSCTPGRPSNWRQSRSCISRRAGRIRRFWERDRNGVRVALPSRGRKALLPVAEFRFWVEGRLVWPVRVRRRAARIASCSWGHSLPLLNSKPLHAALISILESFVPAAEVRKSMYCQVRLRTPNASCSTALISAIHPSECDRGVASDSWSKQFAARPALHHRGPGSSNRRQDSSDYPRRAPAAMPV